MEEVLKNQYATLFYDEENEIVHHVFHKPIGGKPFREILDAGADLMKEKKAKKWLSDDRNNGIISEEDTNWVMSDWLPRVKAAGWEYWALVVPEDMAASVDMQKFTEVVFGMGVRTFLFSDPDEGKDWLNNR